MSLWIALKLKYTNTDLMHQGLPDPVIYTPYFKSRHIHTYTISINSGTKIILKVNSLTQEILNEGANRIEVHNGQAITDGSYLLEPVTILWPLLKEKYAETKLMHEELPEPRIKTSIFENRHIHTYTIIRGSGSVITLKVNTLTQEILNNETYKVVVHEAESTTDGSYLLEKNAMKKPDFPPYVIEDHFSTPQAVTQQ